MILGRILAVIGPLFLGGLFLLLGIFEKNFYLIFAFSGLWTLLSLFGLLKISGQIKSWRAYVFYLLMGWLLSAGYLLFFIFLEHQLVKALVMLLAILTLFYYYHQLFIRFFKQSLGTEIPPLNLNFLESVVVFFWSMAFFGFRDFLSYQTYFLCLAVLILIFLINWLMQAVLYEKGQLVLFSLAMAVMMTEFFWAFLSLSLVYYLKGLLLAFSYLGLQLTREIYFRKIENRHLLRNYLLLILAVVLAILLSARWF